jgi:hypothetical protein
VEVEERPEIAPPTVSLFRSARYTVPNPPSPRHSLMRKPRPGTQWDHVVDGQISRCQYGRVGQVDWVKQTGVLLFNA